MQSEAAPHIQDFFTAVRDRSMDRARALLAAEPRLALARFEGATALHFAALSNDRVMVDLLLATGADLNARDDTYQMTPIGWANEEGHEELVRHFYSQGAEIDLHQAAAYGITDLIKTEVKRSRRQLNAAVGGWTPLQLATLWGHPEVVELLLSRGADPLMRDPFGRTTLEIARAQVESNAAGTRLVHAERRARIVASCVRIGELLQERGVRV
jgi:ankyrin repeat protein